MRRPAALIESPFHKFVLFDAPDDDTLPAYIEVCVMVYYMLDGTRNHCSSVRRVNDRIACSYCYCRSSKNFMLNMLCGRVNLPIIQVLFKKPIFKLEYVCLFMYFYAK